MTVVYRSKSSTTYASRTNTTVSIPGGVIAPPEDGDILIYIVFVGAATEAPNVTAWPAGFVALSTPTDVSDAGSFNGEMNVAWKLASGEGGTYTATHTAATSQGVMLCFSGAANEAPAFTKNSGTGTTTTATGTTVADESMIVYAAHDWGDTVNGLVVPAGTTPTFTERHDLAASESSLIYVATGVVSLGTVTGNKTQTNNSSGGNPWAAWLLSLTIAPIATGNQLVFTNLRAVQV